MSSIVHTQSASGFVLLLLLIVVGLLMLRMLAMVPVSARQAMAHNQHALQVNFLTMPITAMVQGQEYVDPINWPNVVCIGIKPTAHCNMHTVMCFSLSGDVLGWCKAHPNDDVIADFARVVGDDDIKVGTNNYYVEFGSRHLDDFTPTRIIYKNYY
jgi:hypothetical protein